MSFHFPAPSNTYVSLIFILIFFSLFLNYIVKLHVISCFLKRLLYYFSQKYVYMMCKF